MIPLLGVGKSRLPAFALLLAAVLWSSSFIALKIAFRAYDPMVVIFGRMLVASLCFLLVSKRVTQALHYRRGDYKLILFMAFCEPCLYFIFEAKAVQNTTASQAGMITTTLPLIVAVAAGLFLGERATRQTLLGFVVAIAGACWLSLGAESSAAAAAT